MRGSRSFTRFARRSINTEFLAPWNFGRHVERSNNVAISPLNNRLRPVPLDILSVLTSEGLQASTIDGLESRLIAVDDLLGLAPDLRSIVLSSVATVHPLAAKPGYDISHSQPKWRDRIFVSFPERQDEIGELRLTESVVHEAMHLHLTNEETRTEFVATSTNTLYSPWMKTLRPASGVLHGLFVFYSVGNFLLRVLEQRTLAEDANRYVNKRLNEIQQEISEVDVAALEKALTPHGVTQTRFWRRVTPLHLGVLPTSTF